MSVSTLSMEFSMTTKSAYDDLITYFGSVPSMAKALGIDRRAIYQWRGTVPPLRAFQIEKITNGKFKASELNPKSNINIAA